MSFPTPLYMPDHWATMRQALYTWASAEALRNGLGADKVTWLDQRVPQPARPYIGLQVLSGPDNAGRSDSRTLGHVAIQIPAAADATTYTVTINSTVIPYLSGANATKAQIRDGLIAAITASVEPVNAAVLATLAYPDDVLLLTAADENTVFNVAVSTNLVCKIAAAEFYNLTVRFQVDVIADQITESDTDPINNAHAEMRTATALRSSLDASRNVELFRVNGWGFEGVTAVRRLPFFQNQQWIARAGFDMQLTARARDVDLIDWIESAQMDVSIIGSGVFAPPPGP